LFTDKTTPLVDVQLVCSQTLLNKPGCRRLVVDGHRLSTRNFRDGRRIFARRHQRVPDAKLISLKAARVGAGDDQIAVKLMLQFYGALV
jgi:hypothetical protein